MKHLITILSIVLFISGCSTTPKAPATLNPVQTSWAEHVKDMQTLAHWKNNAKIAIKVKDKLQSATFVWRQDQDNFDIVFSGPFGQGGLKLSGDKDSATLLIAKEAAITGPNTSAVLSKRLGWELPVENAQYWILGIPSPLSPSNAMLKQERLTTLSQDGWEISYPKYKQIGDRYLPSKIIISRDDLRLLIAIYKWDIPNQPQ